MPSRDAIARGLLALRASWPSMPDTPELLESIRRVCDGYDDAEFAGGIAIVEREHVAAWVPKPGQIAAACGRVASVRRRDVIAEKASDDSAFCLLCGTRSLVDIGGRMYPGHYRECVRYGAEEYTLTVAPRPTRGGASPMADTLREVWR